MGLTPVTYLIIGLTVLISYQAFTNSSLRGKFLMNPYLVKHNKQYSRVITHGFIHGGWAHLAMNMIVLYFFGRNVEITLVEPMMDASGELRPSNRFGHIIFLSLYVGGLVAGSLPSLIKHGDNPQYNSVGASGAVYAVLLASIVMYPVEMVYIFGIIPIPGILAAVMLFFYERQMQKRGGTGIAHDAHMWGAAFGAVFICLVDMNYLTNFFAQITEAISF